MCRVLTFLGETTVLEDLLYKPDSSLIKQSYNPKRMLAMLNLGGFGMASWDNKSIHPKVPFLYRTAGLPFYDKNLVNLSRKLQSNCLLAHIRGVSFSSNEYVTELNVHPFMFPGAKIALAHNGTLEGLEKLKPDLIKAIKPELYLYIKGNTDSEWMYALLLSQFDDYKQDRGPIEVAEATIKMLRVLRKLRHKNKVELASPINLFISNGEFLITTRFVFNYGSYTQDMDIAHLVYHSMWYTFGEKYGLFDGEYKMSGSKKRKSIIIASEPLTVDSNTWLQVPEYSLVIAWREKGQVQFFTHDIDA